MKPCVIILGIFACLPSNLLAQDEAADNKCSWNGWPAVIGGLWRMS